VSEHSKGPKTEERKQKEKAGKNISLGRVMSPVWGLLSKIARGDANEENSEERKEKNPSLKSVRNVTEMNKSSGEAPP